MLKEYLKGFCDCSNNYLLYMGSYSQKGEHWQDESYPVNCYYCSECGKELQIYTGYHNQETRKLYNESLKYSFISRRSSFVIDMTKMNPDISNCDLDDKRSLVYDIKNKNDIKSESSLQSILLYKKKN